MDNGEGRMVMLLLGEIMVRLTLSLSWRMLIWVSGHSYVYLLRFMTVVGREDCYTLGLEVPARRSLVVMHTSDG